MSHLEVLKRIDQGEVKLLVYRLDSRTPTAQECEDVGEDHGFFEPKQERNYDQNDPMNSILVTEGFQGRLCEHDWGLAGHYGRNPFGSFWRCKKCGVTITTAQRKRSNHVEYSYGEWGLRKHIWDAWSKLGPVPGSLTVQEHHQ